MSESDRFDPERSEPDEEQGLGPEIPAAPGVESPAVTPPGTPGADTTVDPQLRLLFWKLILLYKVAILGLTLGILLVVFDTYATTGRTVLAGSAVLFGYTLYRTRRGKSRLERGEFDTDEERSEHDTIGEGGDTGGSP